MLGRTLLQPAPPVTFGLKAAGWLASIRRGRRRLQKAFRVRAVLQFGGASGTLASLGDRGIPVAEALSAELGLGDVSANALAHSARSTRHTDLCLRSSDWISRQDGARYQSAHAERGGRGGRARRRRPRRILNHAEQAQPYGMFAHARGVRIACLDWLLRFSLRCCRSTSAASEAGRRSGPSLRS